MRLVFTIALLACGLALATRVSAQTALSGSPYAEPPAATLTRRVEADLGLAPAEASTLSYLRWGPVNVRPHLTADISYGDGINASPGNQQKTAAEVFTVGVLFELGSKWTLDYTPTLSFYSNDAFRNHVDHAAVLAWKTTYENWRFDFLQLYTTSATTLDATATQTETESFLTKLGASYYLGGKWMMEFGVTQDFELSEEFNSTKSWSTLEWLNYQVASRLSFGIGLGGGYENVSLGSDMTHATIQGRVTSVITKKINLNVHGGGENRHFVDNDAENLINPVYGATLQYQPFPVTTFSLTGNRAVQSSLFANQITETTQLSVALRQRIFGAAFVTLSADWVDTGYLLSEPGLASTRADDTFGFRASLSYGFFERMTSSVYFQYREQDSNLPGFAYSSTMVGINVGYSF